MRIESTRLIEDTKTVVADVDIAADGEVLALIVEPGAHTTAPGSTTPFERTTLRSTGRPDTPVVAGYSPKVRALADSAVLLYGSHIDGANARVVDKEGAALAEFDAGICEVDVVVCDSLVAFTYFDEGVFSTRAPSPEGVAFFDFTGKLVLRYRSDLSGAPPIYDCYAAAADEEGRLLISPYPDFQLVRIVPRTRTWEVFDVPEVAQRASALSVLGDRAFFWVSRGPAMSHGEIFEFEIGGEARATSLGTLEGRVRGLTGGRFLRVTQTGFDVITVAN